MDVQDFVERLLFASSLEEKLLPPPRDLSFSGRRGGLRLSEPVRPCDVPFDDASPVVLDARALESKAAQARLFHRFLDHELLAVELLALAIHRFADAPQTFRRDLLTTLAEEQIHVGLYLECLRTAGGEYGSYPWTSSFWRLLRDVPDPMSFVCGMNLGLEQANLDFAVHYLGVMGDLGHERGAETLTRILADEVRHVRRGLRWFREWKEEGQDDFTAWKNHLPEGFAPRRAKGLSFSSDLRREVGLDESYIRSLRTLSGSRGRRPDVYLFNPDCEGDLAAHGEVAPGVADGVARDLELLPLVFASQDDVLLVSKIPEANHLERLVDLGFPLPELVLVEGRESSLIEASLASRPLGRFVPWGKSPRWLPLASRCDWLKDDPDAFWSSSWGASFRKSWAYTCSDMHLEALPGRVIEAAEDLEEAVGSLRREGAEVVVLKADLGSAGRGMTRVFGERIEPPAMGFARRVLASQGRLVVEPWHDRVIDVSGHFSILDDGRVRWDGLTRFFTDARGRYRGTSLGIWCDGLPSEEGREIRRSATEWEKRLRGVGAVVGRRLASFGCRGAVSFDAYVYRAKEGGLELRELVEVNPRFSMGRVALRLRRRRLAPGVVGAFFILGPAVVAATGAQSMVELMERFASRYPPTTILGAGGMRVNSGVVWLTPVTAGTRFAAVMVAGRGPLSDPAFSV